MCITLCSMWPLVRLAHAVCDAGRSYLQQPTSTTRASLYALLAHSSHGGHDSHGSRRGRVYGLAAHLGAVLQLEHEQHALWHGGRDAFLDAVLQRCRSTTPTLKRRLTMLLQELTDENTPALDLAACNARVRAACKRDDGLAPALVAMFQATSLDEAVKICFYHCVSCVAEANASQRDVVAATSVV